MEAFIPFKQISLSAKLPTRGTEDSAGLDLYSDETVLIKPQTIVKVKTGLKCAIPKGHFGKIEDKSSIVTKKFLKTIAGVIDSDYRGEIIVCMFNLHPKNAFLIQKGEAFAQIIIQQYANLKPVFECILPTTSRGEGGFGSTSK